MMAVWVGGRSVSVAGPGAAGYTVRTTRAGVMGVRETSHEIMERERQTSASQHARRSHLVLRPDFQNLPSNPDSPNVIQWPPAGFGSQPAPMTPQVASINFLGATLADTEYSFPPDSMGAAGPSQFIVA